MFTTLISTEDLAANLSTVAVIDCRFNLAAPERGEQHYLTAHIPSATYAHLDRDLSSAKTGTNGRHPLPTPAQLIDRFSQWGITAQTQVVAYDDAAGIGTYAARLWWLLRYMGHHAVAVLDGGFDKWHREGRPTQSGVETRAAATFTGQPNRELWLSASEIEMVRLNSMYQLIDVRAPERYRGETEPLDPVAGHIPGAMNWFYKEAVTPDGTFLAPADLREKLLTTLNGREQKQLITYCGSGVTASHTLFALELAGITHGKLYAGSWSEWCADKSRAVARGEETTTDDRR